MSEKEIPSFHLYKKKTKAELSDIAWLSSEKIRDLRRENQSLKAENKLYKESNDFYGGNIYPTGKVTIHTDITRGEIFDDRGKFARETKAKIEELNKEKP